MNDAQQLIAQVANHRHMMGIMMEVYEQLDDWEKYFKACCLYHMADDIMADLKGVPVNRHCSSCGGLCDTAGCERQSVKIPPPPPQPKRFVRGVVSTYDYTTVPATTIYPSRGLRSAHD